MGITGKKHQGNRKKIGESWDVMLNKKQTTCSGFSLLEILIVIAIITLLASFLIPNIFGSQKKAQINATRADIAKIKGMLEQYRTKWGDYPLTVIPGFTDANKINQGIETLVACLADTTRGGPFIEWEEKRYTNYDNDISSRQNLTWLFGDAQLREIVDFWGSPFVYFHSRDYDNPGQYSLYSLKKGSDSQEFSASPQRSSVTKTFHNPYEYQLWSIGPDGENQNGLGDDIGNW